MSFVPLQDFGSGGAPFAANNTTICGATYVETSLGNFSSRATVWTSAGPQRLSGFGDYASECKSINFEGIYVGSTRVPISPTRTRPGAFIGRGGTGQVLDFPGFEILRGSDINDSNQFIGTWNGGNAERGYVATAFENNIRDLGLLSGYAGVQPQAINNQGFIVGSALQNGTFARALIWEPGATQPTDFNTLVDVPGVNFIEAMDINNAGQILARGNNGYYIFTPNVPEPAGMALFTVAAVAVRRRRVVV